MKKGMILIAVTSIHAASMSAQTDSTRFRLPIGVQGEFGTSGEYYTVTGAAARQPSTTGELFVRARFTLPGGITSELDLLFSSEQGSSLSGEPGIGRQRLNRLGITPTWSWGRAYLGSFSDSYSKYTFNAIRVTGGGFAVNPGLLRVATVYGTTDQPVLGGATDGTYRRRLLGGRLGIGRSNRSGEGTFVDFTLLRVWDDVQSLPADATVGAPVGGVPVNTLAVTPQENVVAGLVASASLFDSRLRLDAEVTAAVHSRDRRAPELAEETLPSYAGVLRGLLTPRVSTHADYAYRLDAQYRFPQLPGGTPRSPRTLVLAGEFSYIGPGYVSLGTAGLPNDQRAVGLRTQVRFARWNATVHTRWQDDNLIGQKLATTTRTQVGGTLSIRMTQRWNTSFRANVLGMNNDSDDPMRQIAFASRGFGLTNSLSFAGRIPLRSVSLTYGFQNSGDSNPDRADGTLLAHNVDVRFGFSLSRAIQISPSVGVMHARSQTEGWSTRETLAISVSTRLLNGRLSNTAAIGTSRAEPNQSTRMSLSSQLKVSPSQTVSLRISTNQYRSPPDGGTNFREYTVSIRAVRSIR